MKLYTWYTSEFEIFRDIFVATIKDDYELVCPLITMDVMPNASEVGGGHVYNAKKTELILEAIAENVGGCILFTDIDLQFFERTSQVVVDKLRENDLVFQREFIEGKERKGNINLGFTAMRCNEKTMNFHKEVLRRVNLGRWDQAMVNEMLYEEHVDVKWDLFPPEIWTLHCYYLNTQKILLHHPVISDLHEKLKNMVDIRRELRPGDGVLSDILRRHDVDLDDVKSHPFHVETDSTR